MQQKIGYFSAYGAIWKYYADFSSRTSGEAFWKGFFIHSLIILVMMAPTYYVYESIIEWNDITAGLWLIPLAAYSVATIVPSIALIIRRLHDTDRHGCWFFLYFIPVAGTIMFFIMLSKPSAPFDVYPGRSGEGPYAPPPQNPYAPYYVYRPLPPPRRFAPPAGAGKAILAIILSLAVAATSNVYSFVSSDYLQKNMYRYINTLLDNAFSFDFGDYGDFYEPDGGLWGDTDPWSGGNMPWDDEEFWNDVPGFEWFGDEQPPDEELAAIDLVRESALDGFPEYTVEEVLITRVEDGMLEWDCLVDESGESEFSYVSAWGYAIGDFVRIYAGFDVYEDGRIELYKINDGERNLYGGDALEMYGVWYEEMLLSVGKSDV